MATVAVVVPALRNMGGVQAVARFLFRVLRASDRYDPFLVSLAMCSSDPCSVRLRDPRSWLRGVRVERGTWEEYSYRHVGAFLAEIEFMRYAPRPELTEILREADLVQVVAGAPCWALSTAVSSAPIMLQVATFTARERRRRHRVERGFSGLWRRAMTAVTKRLDRIGLQKAERIFVENRWMEDKVTAIAGSDCVIFSPPGVDVDRFRPREEGEQGPQEKYILAVARFSDPRKNPELLFEAYARLQKEVPSAPVLWLAGSSGPPESAWSIARDRGVAERIRYVGEVSDPELARLYRHAVFFVLSSDEEGFGVVLVEAMASGVPVVSTDSGGPGDVVTDGEEGFLVPVDESEALAGAMARLVENPGLRSTMGDRARRTAVERYSLRAAGRRFLREYDSVLDDTGSQQGGEPEMRGSHSDGKDFT